jgi:hypothetical protein
MRTRARVCAHARACAHTGLFVRKKLTRMIFCGVTRMRFCGVRVYGRHLFFGGGGRRSMVRILLGRASSRSQSDSRKNWIKSRERSPALLNLRFAGTFAFASHFCNEPVAAFFRSRRSLPLATFVFLPAHLLKDARSHTAHPQASRHAFL